ncbi:MAG TPA: adenylate/guanylate cyclase domain-containing protein [Candidatus Didemnitutus sp.]|nr:adenylate/guanylate cyclase domain-containing protein [Candidatus Didemnitutus sp.]
MTPNHESQRSKAEGLLRESQSSIVGGLYEEGIRRATEALEQYQAIDDRYGIASACNNIGIACSATGDFPRALEMYRKAIDIWTDLGNSAAVASALHNVGRVMQEIGDYPGAFESFMQARVINEQSGELQHLAHNITSLATIRISLREYDEAIAELTKALAIYEQLGDQHGRSIVLTSIGSSLLNSGQADESLRYFTEALEIRTGRQEEHLDQYMVLNIGIVHAMGGRIDEARTYLQRSNAVDIPVPALRCDRFQLRARILQAEGDLIAARSVLLESLSEAEQYAIKPAIAVTHQLLRDLALLNNNLGSYVHHNNAYTAITDEISGTAAVLRIALQAKELEYQKQLAVLHSTLPKDVADRVARGEVVNDHYDNASVLFLDIVGFTELSSTMSSAEVISLLDDVFSQCDAICAKHGITKIKTIGDSYMAFGIANSEQRIANSEQRIANAEQRIANSEQRIANAALEMMKIELNDALKKTLEKALHKPLDEALIKFRIGIHTGPVTAGVIGKERFQYDVWGDTVNIASRMESTSEPGRIHVTEEFAQRCGHPCIPREAIDVKGRGMMQTFWIAQ